MPKGVGISYLILSNPHFALVYSGWGIVGLNIDRCISPKQHALWEGHLPCMGNLRSTDLMKRLLLQRYPLLTWEDGDSLHKLEQIVEHSLHKTVFWFAVSLPDIVTIC